jgi:DNA sulfur modification protein DndD
LSGLYPLSLAPELLRSLEGQLKSETTAKQARIFTKALELKLPDLVNAVTNEVGEHTRPDFRETLENTLRKVLGNVFGEENRTPPLHDLSDREQSRLVSWIHEATELIPGQASRLRSELEKVSQELSTITLQLERIPDEAYLAQELAEIKALQTNIGIATEKHRATAELIRNLAWQAIELLRSMRRLESRVAMDRQQRDTYGLASRTKGLLLDFAADLRRRKIQSLQTNFRDAFVRLARKDDVLLRVEIDPDTFDVTLFGKNGKPIPRSRLSAGEKQIYAIAMLESLMKTSGRALPVIVDTPLGRLDSKHRDKLINSYFPIASHQTILLSTDTEVDERFYETLSPHISRAFHVAYDQGEHFSTINEGYFWRQKEVSQ